MHRARRTLIGSATAAWLLVSLAVGGAGGAVADEPPSFRLVVHPESTARVDRAFVADAFLKKVTRWPDGQVIRAVDLRIDAPARHSFSERVLRRSPAAVRNYWQQRIFTGRGVPPPELGSDQAVLRYVLEHRGAVGYVSDAAELGSVKVLEVR